MAFTQFSQPVQRPDMYKPLSDEVILAQSKARYDRADQEAQKIGSTYNSLFGISTYGKDAEVLSQMQEQFKQQVGELSKQGLANPEVNSRINQLITQYSSDPDVLSVHKRKASLDQELTAKKEAEAKGNQYLCPICEQADEYYASGKYVRDKTFNQTGWLDPNVEKLKREGLKDVQKIKRQEYKNGIWHEWEEYDPEQLSSLYQGIYSNPNVQKTMDYSFEKKYKSYDFATEGVKKLQSSLDQYTLLKNNAWEVMQKNPHTSAKYIQAQQDMTEADERITKYSSLLQNPGNLGENLKTQIKQDELNSLINEDIKGAQFQSEVSVKDDQIYLANQKYAQDKQMELYKALLPSALALGTTPEAIFSGKAKRDDGTIITTADAIQKTHEMESEEAKAKSDVIQQRQIAIDENRQENRIEYLDASGKAKTIKAKSLGKVSLGGEEFDRNTLINSISSDKQTVQTILQSNPSKFGLDCATCSNKIDGNSLVDKGDYYEYQEDDNLGYETTHKVSKKALKAYILNPEETQIDLETGDISGGGEEASYELNGKNFSQSDLEEAAKVSNLTVDEYINAVGIKKK